MSSVELTGFQQAQLGKLIQAQGWAEAHEMNRVSNEIVPEQSAFHLLHRDIMLAERNNLLTEADAGVQQEFTRYMRIRLESRKADLARILEIDKLLGELNDRLVEHSEARQQNWRNYRSLYAHAFDAKWRQELQLLKLEKSYLESRLITSPILLPE